MALDNPAQRYLEILTKGSDQVVFAYEIPANRFVYLNPAFEKIWGKTRKSVQNNPPALLSMIHPEDRDHVQRLYWELLEGVLIPDVEFRIQLRNQTEKWVCVKPRLLEEEQVMVGYANDISAQKEYNYTLKKHSDKKNAILNILSHDLAGPLANIQNLSRVLGKDVKVTDNPENQELIALIEKSCKQGMQLIQEFLKQEFLESAAVTLLKHRVDLVEKTKVFMEEYQQTQSLLQLSFYFRTTSESIYLELDDNKFMQVLNNLISNAIKFTPDGGAITVALEEKEASVIIQVADTGIGIPAKYHATLFEKFTQARRPGIKGEPSVGLGMSIIKTIVEWHQGKIWFESQENKGTTFYIKVPKTQ